MNDLGKILDYFMEFEVMERLTKIEIKPDTCLDVTKEEFSKIEFLRKKVNDKRYELLSKYIKNKIKFKESGYEKKVISKVKGFCGNVDKVLFEEVNNLIDKDILQYPDSYDFYIRNIMNILNDNTLLILHPIAVLENGNKRVPLVTFQCEFTGDGYVVQDYKIQQEALELILALIFQCDIKEARPFVGNDFAGFIKSLSSLNVDNDIYRFISILDEQLRAKYGEYGFKSVYDFNDYEKKVIADQIVISTDMLVQNVEPIFRKEIKKLKERVEKDNTTELINKYIYGNCSKSALENLKNLYHFGSYHCKYPINYKQTNVVSAYLSNNFITVSGPPGTGKTTVLKEIMADNFVRKARELIKKWHEPWREIGGGNQKVYESPLEGLCNYSIIVTSTNNGAVDNIGVELMKEVEYFGEIASKREQQDYKGIFCARLGKSDNIKKFVSESLNPLIDLLENSSGNNEEINDEDNVKDFIKNWDYLNNAYNEIEEYLEKRDRVTDQIFSIELVKNLDDREEFVKLENLLKDNIKSLENEISNIEIDILNKEEKMKKYTKELLDTSDKLETITNESDFLQQTIDKYNKCMSFPIVKVLFNTYFRIKYGNIEKIKLQQTNKKENIFQLNKVREYAKKSYDEILEQVEKNKQKIEDKNSKIKSFKDQKKLFDMFRDVKSSFEHIREKYELSCNWNDKAYSFSKEFMGKRHELFKLALLVNRAYIIKNEKCITHNLKKVYVNGNWFSPFYRETFDYNDSYKEYIKAMWETLFICFPVVTTTLHSFSKNIFHMIEGLFDTIMIDEAGQVLPHYAVTPLYRARRTIIVGDTLQLKPIYNYRNNVIQAYKFDAELESNIDIQKNSVQHCADAASDVYEKIGDEEKGIMLEEHRRCEKSIMQFSNEYLYKNRLKLLVENSVQEFLGSNLCFVDTRGIKRKNNTNLLEVKVCKKIVEWFTQKYGPKFKEKIGIITPFKNQKELLKNSISGVEIGTVNMFQGREKEVIILSSVIEDAANKKYTYSTGIRFVGDEPNFLNVTFSRAKKQLIVVGNYNAYFESDNFLYDAIESIRKYGRVYSIYNMNLMCENLELEFWEQLKNLFDVGMLINDKCYNYLFKDYLENGLLVGKKHYSFLKDSFKLSSKSVHVVSPWITSSVINDEMIELIKQKLEENNNINICFGYNYSSYTLPNEIDKIVKKDSLFGGEKKNISYIKELYKLLNNKLKYKPPLHTKALIIDKKFMVIGSHNWLSKIGERKNSRDELSCVVTDKDMMDYVIKRYF